MGQNLALNFAERDVTISVYNRTSKTTFDFVSKHYTENLGKRIVGFETVEDFIQSLQNPRIIILLVKSDAVEAVVDQLIQHLSPEDTVVDMGNSYFRQSRSISQKIRGKANFVDCGISGGEEGARHGASFMLGGDSLNPQILELLRLVAARKGDYACAEHFTGIGAGHFIKMVHNAIEYAVMQFLAEIYACLVKSGQSLDDIIQLFSQLASTGLDSYLLKISIDIFKTSKENGVLDDIEEIAGQKGTGKWTIQTALDYGVGVPCLTAAVESRFLSKVFLLNSVKLKSASNERINSALVEDVFKLTLFAIYDEATRLLKVARDEEGFNFDLKMPFKVWQAGCILAADHLELIARHNFENANSLFEQVDSEVYRFFVGDINKKLSSMQAFVNYALRLRSFIPVTLSAAGYINGLHSESPLGFNLIQAQRDYFGKHGVVLKSSKDHGLQNIEWLKSE